MLKQAEDLLVIAERWNEVSDANLIEGIAGITPDAKSCPLSVIVKVPPSRQDKDEIPMIWVAP